MSYNDKLTSLHKGLTPIFPDQDRINFAPQLRGDIRILDKNGNFFTFNKKYTSADTDYPNLAGTVWVVGDLAGWFTLSEPYVPDIPRGFGDGSFDVDGRFLAREITLTGTVLLETGNRSDTRALDDETKLPTSTVLSPGIDTLNFIARKQIIDLFNLVRRGAWLVVDEDSLISTQYEDYPHNYEDQINLDHKRACFVRLAGQPEIETVNSRGRIIFQIPLKAADPIKYEWVDVLAETPDFDYISDNGYNLAYVQGLPPTSEFREYTLGSADWEIASGFTDTSFRTYSDVGFSSGTFTDYATGHRSYSGDVAVSTESASSNIICINHGNVNVSCLLRVVGPIYGPADITNETTGQNIRILASDSLGIPVIDAGEYMEIDTKTRDVRKGDSSFGLSPFSSRGLLEPLVDWIELVPGENIISFTDLNGTGVTPTLQVYWRSGWIG